MSDEEKQIIKDALYSLLILALSNADEKSEKLANKALGILEKYEMEGGKND